MSEEIRGCGGTLRMVIRELTRNELPSFVSSGRRAHAVCEHPDGTVHEYVGIPTPGEQLAHEFPDLAGGEDHERQDMTDPNATNDEPVNEDDWVSIGALFIGVYEESDDGEQVARGAIPYAIEANGARRRALFPSHEEELVPVAEWNDGDPESLKVHDVEGLPPEMRTAIESQLADVIRGETPKAVNVINWDHPVEHLRRLRRLFYAAELMHRAGAPVGDLASLVPEAAHELYDRFTMRMVDLGPFGAPGAKALSQLRKGAIERARIDTALAALVAVPADADLIRGVVSRREQLMREHAQAEEAEHDAMNTLIIALKGSVSQ